MEKLGILYGVGVGPGDPELITLRALRTIEACPVIAAPRTAGGRMLALEIASQSASMEGKLLLPLDFTMDRRPEARRAAHQQASQALLEHLAAGRDTAFLTLGDVSVYSTFDYVRDLVAAAGYETRRVPGVTSFCAAAARLDMPLAVGREPIHILPAGDEDTARALSLPGTKVLMKAGGTGEMRELLRQGGKLERAAMVRDCGLPDEFVCRDLSACEEEKGYFATVIVKE